MTPVQPRHCPADERLITAGRMIGRLAAIGRFTNNSMTLASMVGGPIKAMVLMDRRVLRGIECTGRAHSSYVQMNGHLPFTVMGTPACSASPRSSGRVMCIRPGKHLRHTSRSPSTLVLREFHTGGQISGASCLLRNTPGSCMCVGSNSVRSVRFFVHTAEPGI